jgi:medium-chain acyl-[acyl-carrier-protein] hydrolase
VSLPASPWLLTPRANARATCRVLCIPHAGTGAASYAGWARLLPDSIEWTVAQLPGREARLREPALASVEQAVQALADVITRALDDRPLVLFGHSMGALISFELAHELRRRGDRDPAALFVSGRGAPGTAPADEAPLAGLPDDQLLSATERRWGRLPAAVLADPDMRRYVLAILRADLRMLERFRPALDRPPLACPIAAYAGDADPSVAAASLDGWRAHTAGAFALRRFTGDHFYHQGPSRADLLDALTGQAVEWLRASAGGGY